MCIEEEQHNFKAVNICEVRLPACLKTCFKINIKYKFNVESKKTDS